MSGWHPLGALEMSKFARGTRAGDLETCGCQIRLRTLDLGDFIATMYFFEVWLNLFGGHVCKGPSNQKIEGSNI